MDTQDTINTIMVLFNNLSAREQVETLVALYYELDDYHKDCFLEDTENA